MGEGDKKVTLTFTLPWTADVENVREDIIGLLVRDALYEFSNRGPNPRADVEEYVEKRYANLSESFKADKVKSNRNRVKLANGLCLTSVSVEDSPVEEDSDPPEIKPLLTWMRGQ